VRQEQLADDMATVKEYGSLVMSQGTAFAMRNIPYETFPPDVAGRVVSLSDSPQWLSLMRGRSGPLEVNGRDRVVHV
jgi:hypothetical protein